MGFTLKFLLQILRRRILPLAIAFCVVAVAAVGGILVSNFFRSSSMADYEKAVQEQADAIEAYYATPAPVEEEPEPTPAPTPYVPEMAYQAKAKMLITYVTNVADTHTVKEITGVGYDGAVDSTEVTITSANTANPPHVSMSDQGSAGQYARTFTAYLQTEPVMERILDESQVSMSTRDLPEALWVESVNGTSIYQIVAVHPEEKNAVALANAAAAVLMQDALDVFSFNHVVDLGAAADLLEEDMIPLPTPVITPEPTAEPTPEPTPIPTLSPDDPLMQTIEKPAGPMSKKTMILLAGILGLLAAGAALLVMEWADKRVHDPESCVMITRSSVLGILRSTDDAEDIRILRSQLIGGENAPRMIAVAQSVGSEDSRGVALSLARVIAATGRRVLLIDADLRGNWLANRLHLDPACGLSTLLEDGVNSIAGGEETLDLMPAGPSMENPSDLLLSPALAVRLGALRDAYDAVIISAPAVTGGTESCALATLCDGVILVSRGDVTERSDLADAAAMLAQARARVLGNVFLAAPSAEESEKSAQ